MGTPNACDEADKAAISVVMAANFKRISSISLQGHSLHQECP
jgi:hypothetical protein